MSIPVPPHAFEPVWLSPDDVKSWLKLNSQDVSDDALIVAVCAMTEPYVMRCRPEWTVTAEDGMSSYVPDSETYQGARMYAAREYRRRNSPSGIETFGDVTSFVARYDPDIDRALQTGAYARPVIA
jgi:hypothetical protein